MNIILLPDSLSHQFAFADAQCFLAAHHLTPPVVVHLDGEGGVHDAIPTQHLTCMKQLTHSYQLTSSPSICDAFIHQTRKKTKSRGSHQGSLPCRRWHLACRKVVSNIRKEAEYENWSTSQPGEPNGLFQQHTRTLVIIQSDFKITFMSTASPS